MANKQNEILDLQNQSSVAKLLATENITVTHDKSLSTAHFDVKNRVLALPVWENKGKVVYDMLVGHEVSHALYTPADKFDAFIEKYGRNNFDVLNIVEDIRIERLIQQKYAGMPRIFKGAYKNLYESDFFQIKEKNLNDMLFIDRLNVKGKLRDLVDVEFNDEEKSLYDACLKSNTFDEVVELYEKIVEYTKKEKELKKPQESNTQSESNQDNEEGEQQASSSTDGEGDLGESESYIPEAGDVKDDGTESHSIESEYSNITDEDMEKVLDEYLEERKSDSENNAGSGEASGKVHADTEDIEVEIKEDEGITSETQEAFNENVNGEEVDDRYGPAIALWPSRKTVMQSVIGYKKVMEARPKDAITNAQDHYVSYDDANRNIEEDYAAFKKNINKKTGVLVREFERRKAAYQYSRAQESRRGSLDVNKLHKYKYDDQIFQTTMRLADAKSHGMIFFIDYSGSMGGVLQDVLEHTLNLIYFCKKVGIPYEVYSFTSNYSNEDIRNNDKAQSEYEFDMGELVCAQLFSSAMSKTEFELAFKQVSYQVLMSDKQGYYRSYSQYGVSPYEALGGTPLDHTLIAAHHIVKDFEKKHGNQKTNVMILTDGDSHGATTRNCSYGTSTYLTNIKGKTYEISRHGMTKSLTKILKKLTGATLVGFYLPESRPSGNRRLNKMAREVANSQYNSYELAGKNMKKYRKEGFFLQNDCFGYDAYFLLNSDVEIKDEEFDFSGSNGKTLSDNRGEQAKLARQFAKHNTANRKNRIIMTKFAEIIA
jgi:hypothetical protein